MGNGRRRVADAGAGTGTDADGIARGGREGRAHKPTSMAGGAGRGGGGKGVGCVLGRTHSANAAWTANEIAAAVQRPPDRRGGGLGGRAGEKGIGGGGIVGCADR
jgi:hypothetical protein